ncbi:MAG TPA: DUF488 domain-containing protein [Clostridia bacterium]|nr:DUF488 domain-containing protein [Clostridia bacterium]
MAVVYTIGHSTRTLDELIDVLKAHSISTLIDIRAFPASRRLPHFHREVLERALPEAGIRYLWMPELGGRRKKIRDDSPHTELRSQSFRNYADYMLTPEFAAAARRVLALASESNTAIMCAERMYFQCHRMMVSDYFAAHGHEVRHIIDAVPPRTHKLTREAHLVGGQLLYNAESLF